MQFIYFYKIPGGLGNEDEGGRGGSVGNRGNEERTIADSCVSLRIA